MFGLVPIIVLALMTFMVNVSSSVMTPFLPVYAQTLGSTMGIDIGLFTSVFLLTRVFMNSASGIFSDKFGRKRLIIVGIIICSISMLSFTLFQTWQLVLVLRTLQGIGSAMVWTPATALVGDLVPIGKRGNAMGIYNSISMSGWVLGPAIGGAIQWYARNVISLPLIDSFRTVFYSSLFSLIISLILTIMAIHEPSTTIKKEVGKPQASIFTTLPPGLRKGLISLSLFVFAFGFIVSLVEPLLVYHTQKVYELTADEVTSSMALIYSISGLLIIGVQLLAGRLADRFSKKKLIATAAMGAQILTLLMPFSVNVTNIGELIVLWYVFYSLATPAYLALLQDLFPSPLRGTLTGAFLTLFDFGSLIAPIIGYLIYDNFSKTLPFFLSGTLGIATVIALLIFARDPSERKQT